MKCKIIYALLSFASVASYAQDSAKILNEVIVTATKFPVKQSETGKVVNVITQEQLQKSFGKSLGEVLNQQPGMIINGADNNLGTNQTIYMQGASAPNTLILLDGVPLYDPSGESNQFDLNNFALDNIERIEILKGAQSTLYGSDAVAGVINIISKKGEKKPFNVNVDLSAGSYNTYKGAVSISGTNGKGQTYFVSYNKIYSKGFSSAYDSTGKANFDKDGFNQDVFQLNYGFRPSKKISVNLFGKYNDNRADIDAGAFIDDKDYTYHNDNTIAGTSIDYKLNNGFIRLQYNYNVFNRNFTDDSTDVNVFAKYQHGKYNGASHFAEIYANLNLNKYAELLTGADYRQNSSSQSYVSVPDYGFPAKSISADTAKTNQVSAYASLILKTKKGFHTELGGRWNYHSIYGNNFTYSFNPFYLIKSHYKIYANISSGYRVPSIYQLYSEYGNKNLKPETTTSYEGGLQYFSDKLNARVTGFVRDGKDVFLFYTDPITYASKYINGDKQHDYGIETEASMNITKQFSASVNYTYAEGKVSTKNFTGKDTSFFNLYKRPKNILNLSLNYQVTKEFFVSTQLKTVSKAYEPQYMAAPFELKGYYTLGFYGQYSFDKRFIIFADFQNITDQKYFVTRGYTTKGFNANGGVKVRL
ncbi:MAG: TonB-dependent receptor [Bacteroidota bacterium]|nr:TonB-dependent receptor [Bacteroidota bacterium]